MAEKTISVITGGSQGIGKAIARKLGQEGHTVVLIARTQSKLEEAAKEFKNEGIDVVTYNGDVGDDQFINGLVSDLIEKYGKIDNVINNAGESVFKNLDDITLEDYRKQVNTNLFGVFNLCKAVLPGMKKKESGSIINISSLAGKHGFAGGTTYSASKHAIMGFTNSLMQEVRQFNIRVAAICPGTVATGFIADRDGGPKDAEKMLQPEDVAEVVATALKLPARALASEIDIRPTNPK